MQSLRNICRLLWTLSNNRITRRLSTEVATETMTDTAPYKVKSRKVLRLNKGVELTPSSYINIEVVSPGGKHGAKSVILITSHSRYLFNCGEGTQRYLNNETRGRIVTIDDVFITHNSWNNIGGYLGFILGTTIIEHPNNEIKLHGPPRFDLAGFIGNAADFAENGTVVEAGVKHFKKGTIASIVKKEYDSGPYIDSQLRVDYVPLRRDDIDANTDRSSASDGTNGNSDNEMGENSLALQEKRELDIAIAFIITPHNTRKRISMEKVSALGLKTGPWLHKITNGETVEFDGKEVCTYVIRAPDKITSDDITFQPEGKGPIIVLECPSERFLQSLVTSEQLLNLCDDPKTVPEIIVHMSPVDVVDHPDYQAFMQRNKPNNENLYDDPKMVPMMEIIVHMSPVDVVDHPVYQVFMQCFGGTTKHLMLNERSKAPIFHNALEFHQHLHLLNPQLFPDSAAIKMNSETPNEFAGNIIQGGYFNQFAYRGGKTGFCWTGTAKHRILTVDERLATFKPEMVTKINDLHHKLDEFRKTKSEANRYPEVVFLGTSASVSSKYRNVACILVHTSADSCMLLDCGESTIIQLLQCYGDEADAVLCKLKAVFISHVHLDHHGGLIGMIKARDTALKCAGLPCTKLLVLCPYRVRMHLSRYHDYVEPLWHSVHGIDHKWFTSGLQNAEEKANEFKESLHLNKCEIVQVAHSTRWCFGIVLEGEGGWKLVYSGDTRPCDNLIAAGKDCDILLHEGTFDKQHEKEAVRRSHSTVDEAISVGKRMNARYLMLTHFSTRTRKFPISIGNHPPNVGMAYDFMRVNLDNLPSVQMHEDALLSIFQLDYDQMVSKLDMKLEKKAINERGEERIPDSGETEWISNKLPSDSVGKAKSLAAKLVSISHKRTFHSDVSGACNVQDTFETKALPSETKNDSVTENTEKEGEIKCDDSADKQADNISDKTCAVIAGGVTSTDDGNSNAVEVTESDMEIKADAVEKDTEDVTFWEKRDEVTEGSGTTEGAATSSGDKMVAGCSDIRLDQEDNVGDHESIGEHVAKKQKLMEPQ